MVRQTHRFFFTGGPSAVVRVPSHVCCEKVALQRARLRVGACTDRLLSPCHHPPVSSLLSRICLVGRTMAPSQLEAAPTHKRKRLVFTLPKVRRRTLSVPYTTPCTPPLHSCFTSKQRSFGSLHWPSPTRNRVGLLRPLFLPKVKHYLRAGSAKLEILHQANRRGFLSFRVGGNFSVIKNVLEMFVKMGL